MILNKMLNGQEQLSTRTTTTNVINDVDDGDDDDRHHRHQNLSNNNEKKSSNIFRSEIIEIVLQSHSTDDIRQSQSINEKRNETKIVYEYHQT
uniref:Uncharacterized protein n=1 Tax=Sarcoptes scabiei TaxID=52283 RepID=A0A834R368_SARSC